MGQGYSLTTLSAGSAGIDVPELADIRYEKSLGDARFMKAVRARHKDGVVIAKVAMKPYSSMKFGPYIKEILRERNALVGVPNAQGYHRAFETSSNGYLVRQFIYTSLYDRLSTRPFLEDIEKKWIAFQLLCAVRDSHAINVYHGDIKTENTLLTSWNWVYLTDFSSSFKPTYLPEDNPADFSFFFDISGRRTCYLAPERFISAGEKPDGRSSITWAMDIFSVGCVIAELFLETPIFNLSQLYRYRKGEFDVKTLLRTRIEDEDVREMIAHMVQVDPEMRYSAEEYLTFWKGKAFPEYFYSFLHEYMRNISEASIPSQARSKDDKASENFGKSDERIERVHNDYDKISFFLGYHDEAVGDTTSQKTLFPLYLNLPNKSHPVNSDSAPDIDDGTLLLLSVVTSAVRTVSRSACRLKACDLLLAFAEHATDETKLDRILPFILDMTNDPSDSVKVAALRSLTQLVSMVSTVNPINANVFTEYIFPRLGLYKQNNSNGKMERQSPIVRIAFASCLATLAEVSAKFLDYAQALRVESANPNRETKSDVTDLEEQGLFDEVHADLVKFFEEQTKILLTDPNPDVRRAFLGSVGPLCVFFGSAKASDVILSHINTYLNDRDWRLKSAFFETIVGVAAYVGSTNVEEFILPLIIQSLSDPEESVVEKVLRSFASMAQLGLFQRATTWELIDLISRFTMHPNIWIRQAATFFLSSATKYISVADCYCIVKPLLSPYLRTSPPSFSEVDLLDALSKPLGRFTYDLAITWASKADKGIFWKSTQKGTANGLAQDQFSVSSGRHIGTHALAKVPKNEEDQQWIDRLRNSGMRPEDEFKLLVLKDHIWRVAKARKKDDDESPTTKLNRLVKLNEDLKVNLQTVTFTHRSAVLEHAARENGAIETRDKKAQTITDALLDASTALDDPAVQAAPPDNTNAQRESLAPGSQQKSGSNRADDSSPLSSSPNAQGALPSDEQSDEPLRGRHSDRSSVDDSGRHQSSSAHSGHKLMPKQLSMRHKASAINLMRQASATKATAATGTTSTNATGSLRSTDEQDGKAPSTLARFQEDKKRHPSRIRFREGYDYQGRDPAVLGVLDSYYIDTFPVDRHEFGPEVVPVTQRQWEKKISTDSWRPSGNLIAHFSEHTGAVTRVIVPADHLFFLTGSDDGTVKVWDAARLERNLAHKSRQTHKHAPGVKITSLCFIENTHCFVSADNSGNVHVVRVDCTEVSSGQTKFGKLKQLRDWQVPEPDSYAVWMAHCKAEVHSTASHSLLILATNNNKVHALNLATMTVLYTLEIPLHHGTPTTFCIDRKQHWLLVGTSHGTIELFDLRFQLRVKSWAIPGASPIHRLALHPIHGQKKKQVCIAGGTGSVPEVLVFDLEKQVCREVYRVASDIPTPPISRAGNPKITVTSMKEYTFWDPDSASRDDILARFAGDHTLDGTPNRGVRAMAVGARTGDPNENPKHGFFIAASPDRKVRFWDMDRVEASCVVSGLEPEEEGELMYLTGQVGADCVVCEERLRPGEGKDDTSSGARDGKGKERANVGAKRASSAKDAGSAKTTPTKRKDNKSSTVVSVNQQQLLQTHMDLIMDVALLEYPFPMIISTDRSGMIYVFS